MLQLKPAQACTPAEIAIRRALGYSNGGPDCIFGTRSSAFGHGGYGGSVGFADPQYAFACGVTKNLFSGRGAERELVTAIRMKLGIPE